MPLIIIDGPEKAGKSTLCRELKEQFGYTIRKWGPIDHPTEYAKPLLDDMFNSVYFGDNIVWDRSWASEHVYNQLLQRPRGQQFDMDYFINKFEQPTQDIALKLMLLGPNPAILAARRDETDLPVDPAHEQALFRVYAYRCGWLIQHSTSDPGYLALRVNTMAHTLKHLRGEK